MILENPSTNVSKVFKPFLKPETRLLRPKASPACIIKEFGIESFDHITFATNDMVNLILYWDLYVYSCTIYPFHTSQKYL